jgi:hypothetical protein
MKIEGIQAISVLDGQNPPPPPGFFRVKGYEFGLQKVRDLAIMRP